MFTIVVIYGISWRLRLYELAGNMSPRRMGYLEFDP